MRLVTLLILTLIIIPSVSGAIIQGKVYDLELNRLSNVIVEINTVPGQRIISQQGEYFFNVPEGDYTITAEALIDDIKYLVNEKISIVDDGEYIIDLFLLPELEDIPNINLDLEDDRKGPIAYLIVFVLVILILFFSFKVGNKKEIKIDDDDSLNSVYNFIKKEKRTTQKEIRKGSSLSEAKISLIITQLEKEGKIQKIKKGRSNIIILNK
tara:strand:- start:2155 stop:2787 length:633 start_codon:yes stop_codon:yes gene_type:complete